jgi:hypothetical protein
VRKKRRKNLSEKLIDYIAEKSCRYPSDLLLPENSASILRIVSQIFPESFPPCDWSASLSYLTGRHLFFQTSEAAKDYYIKYLIDHLSKCKVE